MTQIFTEKGGATSVSTCVHLWHDLMSEVQVSPVDLVLAYGAKTPEKIIQARVVLAARLRMM